MPNRLAANHITPEGEVCIKSYWARGFSMKAKWLLITRVPNSAVIVPLFSYEEGGLHITMDRHKGLVYEVYSYALPLDAQLAERRAWNTPKALKEIT